MRIAVIGGGVSGLSATWALNEHSNHQVHLFEPGEYVGGHTHTVKFDRQGKPPAMVDTGFIVFNSVTYPNFLRFLNLVKIPILESDMSFSVTRSTFPKFSSLFKFPSSSSSTKEEALLKRGGFEWAGGSPISLFCQKRNLLDPNHWRMVFDILKFNIQSLETLRKAKGKEDRRERIGIKAENGIEFDDEDEEESIGDWLDKRDYGEYFWKNYLIPMTSSIWSTPPSVAFRSFPAITLLRFMHNHHLLQILNRPQWLTIKGGSKNYVARILSKVPPKQLHRNEKGRIISVRKQDEKWFLRDANGNEGEGFDKILFSTHADITKEILEDWLEDGEDRGDAKTSEKQELSKVLGNFGFSQNKAVLHYDEELMPVKKSAWSAWNFLAQETSNKSSTSQTDKDSVSLTYWMNLLQSLPSSLHGPILVTLNPPKGLPSPSKTLESYTYEHPIYTSKSVSAQKALAKFQGFEGLGFSGAWLNYGFHEDGFSTGLKSSVQFGATSPFEIKNAERELPNFFELLLQSIVIRVCDLVRRWIAFFTMPMILIPLIFFSLWIEFGVTVVQGLIGQIRSLNGFKELVMERRAIWEDSLGLNKKILGAKSFWKLEKEE